MSSSDGVSELEQQMPSGTLEHTRFRVGLGPRFRLAVRRLCPCLVLSIRRESNRGADGYQIGFPAASLMPFQDVATCLITAGGSGT